MKHTDIYSLRKNYSLHSLDEAEVNSNPIVQFQLWLEEALKSQLDEPYAFNLATVDKFGQPDSRIVLLRSAIEDGFSFFTNYGSAKASEIEQNPKASMNFFWAGLERQVRIQGVLQKLSSIESDDYFKSRPRESQIGAWASEQSSIIPNRKYLDERVAFYSARFEGKEIERPLNWGGFLLHPHKFEFWQGRESRLHDRIIYSQKNIIGLWKIERLSP